MSRSDRRGLGNITKRTARNMAVAGIVLLVLAFSLALYSVPSQTPPLPSFPFLSTPLNSVFALLVGLSLILLPVGWIVYSDSSLMPPLLASAVIFASGILLKGLSILYAVPMPAGGETLLVEPYGAHANLVIVVGPLLGFFTVIFHALRRFDLRRSLPSDSPSR